MPAQIANNSLYWKAFNEDYRVGGRYHNLDNASKVAIVTLQAYAGATGLVSKRDGQGYGIKELSEMIDLNYRTTKKALMVLEGRGDIRVLPSGAIEIVDFVKSNTERDASASAGSRKRLAIDHSIIAKESKRAVDERMREVLNVCNNTLAGSGLKLVDGYLVDIKTGEIVTGRGGQSDDG